MKTNVMIRIDRVVVRDARLRKLNISRIAEDALRASLGKPNLMDRVDALEALVDKILKDQLSEIEGLAAKAHLDDAVSDYTKRWTT